MKKVEMVIAPFKINDVKKALTRIGINKMTVSKARRFGGHVAYMGYCRGGKYESKYEPAFRAETKIEFEVAEEDLERALAALAGSAEGAAYGDEKVSVYSLDDTIKLGKKKNSMAVV